MITRPAIACFVLLLGTSAAAQERPNWSAEGSLGYAAFLDEDPVDHTTFGGALRKQISPRWSVGPEVVYMIGPGEDRDLFATGNVWLDVLGPGSGRRRPVSPYVVAGLGIMRYTNVINTRFTSYEFAVTTGVGARFRLSEHWYLAPEARLGWEAHSRLTAVLGYRGRSGKQVAGSW